MREELIKLLQERVGLDRAKAEQAAEVALSFVKERGPESLKSMLGGQEEKKPGGLGGLFGR